MVRISDFQKSEPPPQNPKKDAALTRLVFANAAKERKIKHYIPKWQIDLTGQTSLVIAAMEAQGALHKDFEIWIKGMGEKLFPQLSTLSGRSGLIRMVCDLNGSQSSARWLP